MAVTDLAAFMVTVQVVPETVSHPLQPVKMDPVAGLAVRVTGVPLPVPALLTVTVRVKVAGRKTPKLAKTVVEAERVTVQAPVPAQPPPRQPSKVEPGSAVAVRVAELPLA